MNRKIRKYKKITKEEIEEIKKLKEKGYSVKKICEELNLPIYMPYYYLSTKKLNYIQNKRKNLSKEEKRKVYERQKEYVKNYWKKRYHEDEEFRKKHIQRVMSLQNKKENKSEENK